MNYEALIFALVMSVTQYLMARKITGHNSLTHPDNIFWICPPFYPITLIYYIKRNYEKKER
jgi:hypothetical protein